MPRNQWANVKLHPTIFALKGGVQQKVKQKHLGKFRVAILAKNVIICQIGWTTQIFGDILKIKFILISLNTKKQNNKIHSKVMLRWPPILFLLKSFIRSKSIFLLSRYIEYYR
jgi:hypothetical protein